MKREAKGESAFPALATRLEACRTELDQGKLDEAREAALVLARECPAGAPETSDVGIMLFRLGETQASGHLLAGEVQRNTASPEAQRVMSTLLHRAGDLHAARRLMIEANTRDPYKGLPIQDSNKPIVLCVRALHQSCYGISRDRTSGLLRRSLKRGHFSTRHFIDGSKYNVVNASLTGLDLPPVDHLPRPDLIINKAACADLNPNGLEDVERLVNFFPGVPVINKPARILTTSRSGNALRLSKIDGVVFPQTLNIRRPTDPAVALHLLKQTGMGYPLILRQAGSQTGKTMELVQSDEGVLRYILNQELHQPLVAITYHTARDGLGRFRKQRVFFIDGEMFPVVDLRSDHWNLHSADRYRIMADDPGAQNEELRFLQSPASVLGSAHIGRLAEIDRTIGLDFLGIDFTPLQDGRLLVFEANAAMRHNYDHLERFPYRKPFLDKISAAFDRMMLSKIGHASTNIQS